MAASPVTKRQGGKIHKIDLLELQLALLASHYQHFVTKIIGDNT